MAAEYELDQVDFITVGTIGPPGQRVFHLQAAKENNFLLTIEKGRLRLVKASAVAG
jgi:hypothetical protein